MGITYTPHYNLGKQCDDMDRWLMSVITDNMDKVDTALYAKSDSSSTYTKTDTDTLLSGKIANVEKGANDGVATLDANGLIPMSQMPPTALERIVTVADDTARFALTTADVQDGDTVKVLQNSVGLNVMYLVTDDEHLNSDSGYQVYSAGTAAQAEKLANTHTIAGKVFNGTQDVIIGASDVGAVPLGVKINNVSLNDSDITVRDPSIIPVASKSLETPGWYRIMTNANVGTEFTGILNIARTYYNTFPEIYQIALSYNYSTDKSGIKAVMTNKHVRVAGITKIRFIRSGQSNAHIEIYYALDKNNAVAATMTNFCSARSDCKWESAGFAAGGIPNGYLCDEVDLTTPDLQSQIDKIATEGCVMQRIAAYTNLDTMTTQGNYYSLNSSDTASLVNCPFSGSGGKIRVETITPVFVMQTAIKGWSATTPSISIRGGQLTSGVWSFSPWYRVGLTPMA